MKRFFVFFAFLLFCFAGIIYSQEQTHVIQKGETLYSLAKKYGFSVEEICAYNNITDATKVKAGQQLTIPSKTPSTTAVTQAAKPAPTTMRAFTTENYTVQSGDTFYSLARKHTITVTELLALNKLSANAVLKSGQKLLVPSQTTGLPFPPLESSTTITLTDPRTYENRKVDTNIIWPVTAKDVVYSTGKTFSVVLGGQKGERVRAIKSGLVIFSGMYRGFGQVVFVHAQATGHIYVYSGLDTVSVSKGEKVNFGETLGTLGIDSISGKSQLNFMVFYNGKPVDPATVPRG